MNAARLRMSGEGDLVKGWNKLFGLSRTRVSAEGSDGAVRMKD